MAFSDMKREIARSGRITTKIEKAEAALAKLYDERKGLYKDQWFVWCKGCGRNDAPVDTCLCGQCRGARR